MALGWPANIAAGAYALSDQACMQWLRARNLLALDHPTDPAKNEFTSDTREIRIDGTRGILAIDTARTAGGFASAGQSLSAPSAGVDVRGEGAGDKVTSELADCIEREPLLALLLPLYDARDGLLQVTALGHVDRIELVEALRVHAA